jgi:hypothetical protein
MNSSAFILGPDQVAAFGRVPGQHCCTAGRELAVSFMYVEWAPLTDDPDRAAGMMHNLSGVGP